MAKKGKKRKRRSPPKDEQSIFCPWCGDDKQVYEDPPDSEVYGCGKCWIVFTIEQFADEAEGPAATVVAKASQQGPRQQPPKEEAPEPLRTADPVLGELVPV